MKYILSLIITLAAFACQSKNVPNTQDEKQQVEFVATAADSAKLQEIIQQFAQDDKLPTGALIVKIGEYLRETPYVAHTLESEKEELIVNLHELDCTTFDESCLALARTIKSGGENMNDYVRQLQQIRYREGELGDYSSRLHYFSDWLYDNTQMGIIAPLDSSFQRQFDKPLNFMSTHPDSYSNLKGNPEMKATIAAQEQQISLRKSYWLPKAEIPSHENEIQDGDIVALTTSVAGLDIAHVGFAVHVNGRIHLLHASSSLGKVVISEEPLADYLANKKSFTGIMLARPL